MPRYRINYSKREPASFISHLDLVRTLERSFRRAGLPLAYSEGFNPHPRFSFAAPLPVGIEGTAEVLDVELREPVGCSEFAVSLNEVLPLGLSVIQVAEITGASVISLAKLTTGAYMMCLISEYPSNKPTLAPLEDFLGQTTIEVLRRGKDGREKIKDIRPGIIAMEQLADQDGLVFSLMLKIGGDLSVRPEDVLESFAKYSQVAVDKADLRIIRTKLSA